MLKATFFLALFALAQPERATVTVYSYQTQPVRLAHFHTWATFAKGGDSFTISWYPKAPPGFVGEVEGENKSHDTTLKFAADSRAVVRQHGPFEIKQELYDAAKTWHQSLVAGKVKYSTLGNYPHAVNCQQAVAAASGRMLPRIGDAGSRSVVRHLTPWFVKQPRPRRVEALHAPHYLALPPVRQALDERHDSQGVRARE